MERNIAYTALFAALIAVLALMPSMMLPFGVPISAQTFGIMLAGAVLGPWLGALAAALYVALGLMGLPIFAGGAGGLAALSRASAGFLVAYPLSAFVIGLVLAKTRTPVGITTFLASLLGGIVMLYPFGVAGIALNAGISVAEAAKGVLIFIPGDVVKAVLAALVTRALASARPQALLSRQ